MTWTSPWLVVKKTGPKLVPFFKSIAIFFVLFPTDSSETLLCVITKCLPIAFLCLFVLMHGMSFKFEYSYSRRIFLGLFFSMIGDGCLVFSKNYFLFGVISFGVAHICYFTAFGIKPFNIRLALAFASFFMTACAVYIPNIRMNILRVIVPVYMILLLSMCWRAVSRLQIFDKNIDWTWPKLCCSLGALSFVISDSILSFNLFIHEIPYSHPLIMLTYYAAQLGIALSVVNSYENREVNQLVIQIEDLKNILAYVKLSLKAKIN